MSALGFRLSLAGTAFLTVAAAYVVDARPPAKAAEVRGLVSATDRDMITLADGSYLMGSPATEPFREADEGPQHLVAVRPFEMAAHSVTRGQWAVFARATKRAMPPRDCSTSTGGAWTSGATWAEPGIEQDDRHPVVCVNWQDAQDYVRWLSSISGRTYRLPTEAEREYAARGGTETPYFTGTTITQQQANFDRAVGNRTSEVGSYPPNPYGLYDMSGNVWEWTEDCFHAGYDGAPADGSAWRDGDCAKRMIRGGSWNTGPSSRQAGRFAGDHVRSANRDAYPADRRYARVGFRVVRDIVDAR